MVVKPGLLFPHQLCADWSAGAAVAKMLRFHLSGPGLSHGPFETSKNVVSGRGRACNHLVYYERKGEIVYLHLFKILFSLPCSKLPVTCCPRISYSYLYFV